MKKILLFLTVMTAAILLTSCQNADRPSETKQVDSVATETDGGVEEETRTEDILENRKDISDDLPDTDFAGAVYRLSAASSRQYEAFAESENGEVCNDAVYARNRTVEERFNVTIQTIMTADGEYVESIRKTAMSGDDVYDICTMFTYHSDGLIQQGLCQNWMNVPDIHFDKPWWIGKAIDSYTVAGKCYVAVGSFNTTTLLRTFAVFFNKKLAESYHIEDLYQTVTEGQWTIDRLDALSRDIYSDNNGDNTKNLGDTYGFVSDTSVSLDTYLPAADVPFYEKDSDGYPEFCLNVEKAHSLLDKVRRLYNENTGSYVSGMSADISAIFSEGGALFSATWIDNAFTVFREMEDDYGILPWPKYDEQQADYLTTSMDNVSAMLLPVTSVNYSLVGIVTEALYAESYKSVMPVYYDVALKAKLSRDQQSVEMLDIIMEGITYDFAFLHYQSLDGITQLFRNMIGGTENQFASYIASHIKSLQKKTDALIEIYKGLE